MTFVIDETLAEAEAELRASLQGEPRESLGSITRFMKCFERLAREVAVDEGTWNDFRPWALRNADRLRMARLAMDDWQLEMGALFYGGGEERMEWALLRRSQHAFAREVFRNTSADEFLAAYEAEDVDEDFHEGAERAGLDAPDYVPKTHTWWRWPLASE
ncbi:hypothetical protein LZC95_21365 [Pendulispora brunnea]|uniref:Uncharacterized protein n=1 Tax=Pendulispora brunnea TaxID=2905690 RepID=A0ABZ2KL28_9BACT